MPSEVVRAQTLCPAHNTNNKPNTFDADWHTWMYTIVPLEHTRYMHGHVLPLPWEFQSWRHSVASTAPPPWGQVEENTEPHSTYCQVFNACKTSSDTKIPTVQLQADYIRAGRPLYHATVMANVWSSLPCLAYLPALPHDCNGKCVSLRWCWTSRQARRLSSGSRLQSQLANASLPGSSVNSQCFLWSKTPKSCGMNKPSCPFYSWPSNKINII